MIARFAGIFVVAIAECLIAATPLHAAPRPHPEAVLPAETAADIQRSIDRGLAFLRSAQDADGGWSTDFGPAVAAISAQAFVQDKSFGPTSPVVRRALAYIQKFEQTDGGIYERQKNLANYQTSVVLMFLASLNDPGLQARVAKAQAFLGKLQYDDAESIDRDHSWFGGAGYNETKRPDLSNTQMMLEALHQSGLSPSDPVYQRALVFVSRSQMNEKTNDRAFAKGSSDGGFIYSPNDPGESKASGQAPEATGPLRTYGSMTYAGFKSLLYCNVSRDDERIKAAYEWIRQNYELDRNPGMPPKQAAEGLYYYYHVFARALFAWGEPVVIDARGTPHNWRIDLAKKVMSLQKADGSWINDADRWLEGDPKYVTALTVQTLQTVLKRESATASLRQR
jgi:squalene-hopene/tetraprenyl-beta-curcumene cyclase